MTNYIITSCSTADMPLAFFEKKAVPYIPFHFMLEEKEYPDDLGQTVSFDEFYSKIDSGAMPTTSQVNVGEFVDFFTPYLEAGQDILHISFSSGLSGTYNSATIAKEQLAETYPDRKLVIVDSLAASSGYGMLLTYAVEMRDEGATLEVVQEWLEENKLDMNHWFFSTNLEHLKRGGRISVTSAFVGGMLNIAPLLNVSNEGKLVPRKKVRGKKQVIREMLNRMEAHAKNGTDYAGKCFISHSAAEEDARKVADLIEERFPALSGNVEIYTIGTVIGSHTGPGTVALFFMGDTRTN